MNSDKRSPVARDPQRPRDPQPRRLGGLLIRTGPAAIITGSLAAGVFLLVNLIQPAGTMGQPGKKKPPLSTKALDIKANKTVEDFTRDAVSLAKDYEEAGQLERARQMLQAVLSLQPDYAAVEAQIKRLDEEILSANEFDVEIDTSAGWGKMAGRATKGQRFRIVVSGEYRFVADLPAGPGGFPVREPIKGDMVEDVPCGSVVGIVVPLDKKKATRARPFEVGVGVDYTPTDDGILFLRVNAPANSRCKGNLQAKLSGYIAKP